MSCALRSILAILGAVLALWTMLAFAPADAHDTAPPAPGHALQHGAVGPIDHHGPGGAPHDRVCTSMIGHCGSVPLHDATASLARRLLVALAQLPPDDAALLGRSPEADPPPPRA